MYSPVGTEIEMILPLLKIYNSDIIYILMKKKCCVNKFQLWCVIGLCINDWTKNDWWLVCWWMMLWYTVFDFGMPVQCMSSWLIYSAFVLMNEVCRSTISGITIYNYCFCILLYLYLCVCLCSCVCVWEGEEGTHITHIHVVSLWIHRHQNSQSNTQLSQNGHKMAL